jgi:hypothetical protein
MWSFSGGIQDEGKTVDNPKQLTVAMFSIIILELLKLQIPLSLVLLELDREFKTNLVEPPLSFRIHVATFEESTLPMDPSAQL